MVSIHPFLLKTTFGGIYDIYYLNGFYKDGRGAPMDQMFVGTLELSAKRIQGRLNEENGLRVITVSSTRYQAMFLEGRITFDAEKLHDLFPFECDYTICQEERQETFNCEPYVNEFEMISNGLPGKIGIHARPADPSTKPQYLEHYGYGAINFVGQRRALRYMTPIMQREKEEAQTRQSTRRKEYLHGTLTFKPVPEEKGIAQHTQTEQEGQKLLDVFNEAISWAVQLDLPVEVSALVREFIGPPTVLFVESGDVWLELWGGLCWSPACGTMLARRRGPPSLSNAPDSATSCCIL